MGVTQHELLAEADAIHRAAEELRIDDAEVEARLERVKGPYVRGSGPSVTGFVIVVHLLAWSGVLARPLDHDILAVLRTSRTRVHPLRGADPRRPAHAQQVGCPKTTPPSSTDGPVVSHVACTVEAMKPSLASVAAQSGACADVSWAESMAVLPPRATPGLE
jgi:hypothetical protein